MPVDSVQSLCQVIQDSGILEPAQVKELVSLQKKFTDAKALAKELMQRGWLTPFQVNQLFLGNKDLVLGSHVLLERLGEGGMGTVYKARCARCGSSRGA